MIEYVKMILLKVSFDKLIFQKELIKALRVVKREELCDFRQWCYDEFSGIHLQILNFVFKEAWEWPSAKTNWRTFGWFLTQLHWQELVKLIFIPGLKKFLLSEQGSSPSLRQIWDATFGNVHPDLIFRRLNLAVFQYPGFEIADRRSAQSVFTDLVVKLIRVEWLSYIIIQSGS